jgi:sialate O-acetylesterase
MKNSILKITFFLLAIFASDATFAKIELPKFFTDNMVLQRETEAAIWGKATKLKTVNIVTSWDNKTYSVKADAEGKWLVNVKTPQAGGPYSISFSDGKELKINNILIGEVWLCSGQSNMEMPLAGWGKILDYQKEIAAADHPQIRLLTIDKATSLTPLVDDVKSANGGWQICSPATIENFSATAYFFGRTLYKSLNVPIGLINSSWGGTIIEAWTSGATLDQVPDFANHLLNIRTQAAESEVDPAAKEPNRVTVLYNAMINPLKNMTIKGAIWYQGEGNADRAEQYKTLMPLMISDWRKAFNNDFPFYLVQLANFMAQKPEPSESNWAQLRDSQFQTLALENTGMAVTIDIGDARDIHPKNKQDVGYRLALNALANTYGKNIAFSGPLYKSYKIEGKKIRISFTNTNRGLKTEDGAPVKGFAIAGPDGKFVWADAQIDGNEVIVSSPKVEFPLAVRYAWADNPECNLYNGADLPASPFKTDFRY